MDKIMTAQDWVGPTRRFFEGHASGLVGKARGQMKVPGPVISDTSDMGAVVAFVDYGSWKADCPHCSGAELVDPGDPVFFCLNPTCPRPNGRDYLRVLFPKNRGAIEAALLNVPYLDQGQNRNWRPGETIEALRARVATINEEE